MNQPYLSALSPYPIPRALRDRKVRNLGDGFILRAIERELSQVFPADLIFSPRVAPEAGAKDLMRCARLVVLAGANQLNDRYTVWPGLKAQEIVSQQWKFVPLGIGLHGDAGFNDGMSEASKRVMEIIHERLEFSSWRCPWTVAYLNSSLPHLSGKFLMTGCPVLYDAPLLTGKRFDQQERSVAVTATERGEFWIRETGVIDAVARRYPKAQKYLVAHQNFFPPPRGEGVKHWLSRPEPSSMENRVEGLRAYARAKGFRIVAPDDADACLKFYEQIDVHVGSRLHAHLLFLSRNKRTYLVPVDNRSAGMAAFLGFPLPRPADLDRHWDFDFEVVRRNAREAYKEMQKFTRSLAP